MKTRMLIIVSFVLLLIAGCEKYNRDENESQLFIPVLIAHGELYGAGKEGIAKQNTLMTTKEEWENLQTAINSVNYTTGTFTETEIDFTTYQIVAVFDDLKNNGGWSIDITDITESADSIVVTIKNLNTGNAMRVVAQPYHIVKIPVSNKKTVFETQGISDKSISGTWKVTAESISGELKDVPPLPPSSSYPGISLRIPETKKGSMGGYTFYNSFGVSFEITEYQQIHLKSFVATRALEDDWGRAFECNILNTAKFIISNDELEFLDLQNNTTILFNRLKE